MCALHARWNKHLNHVHLHMLKLSNLQLLQVADHHTCYTLKHVELLVLVLLLPPRHHPHPGSSALSPSNTDSAAETLAASDS